MKLEDQLAQLAQTEPPNPTQQLTLDTALAAASGANNSMIAVWYVTEDGKLEYSCFRKDFPVADLRQAIEQFANDQLTEEFRSRVRDVVRNESELTQ